MVSQDASALLLSSMVSKPGNTSLTGAAAIPLIDTGSFLRSQYSEKPKSHHTTQLGVTVSLVQARCRHTRRTEAKCLPRYVAQVKLPSSNTWLQRINNCHVNPVMHVMHAVQIYADPAGPGLAGNITKALYRAYRDSGFTEQLPQPAQHGILGPILHARVGDNITVVFQVRRNLILHFMQDPSWNVSKGR